MTDTLVSIRKSERHRLLFAVGLTSSIVLTAIVFLSTQGSASANVSESALFLRSASLATLAWVPACLQCFSLQRGILERVVCFLWWPLKIIFVWYFYFDVWGPDEYLKYAGDNIAFHKMGYDVATYWDRHGVGLIAREKLRVMSINYPAAAYIYGAIYFCFGKVPAVALPWLALSQCWSAILAQMTFLSAGLKQQYAKVVFYYLLFSPVIWYLTIVIYRDIFIILSLLLLAFVTIRFLRYKEFVLFSLGLPLSLILIANLRAEYLLLVLAWIVFTTLYMQFSNRATSLVARTGLISVGLLSIGLLVWAVWGEGRGFYVSKWKGALDVASTAGNYLEAGSAGAGFYAKIHALGPAFFPIVMPFKLLISLTAPFPWDFSSRYRAIEQVWFSAESLLRLALLFLMLTGIRAVRKNGITRTREVMVLIALGGALILSALLGPQGEARYITPGVIFIAPLYSVRASSAGAWIPAIFFAVSFIGLMHVVYAGLRGGF